MKLNKTVSALIGLLIAYLLLAIISYSTFLQIPVFEGEPLVWQSLVEQFTTWIPIILGILYLFKTILEVPLKKNKIVNENKFIIPGLFLVFVSAFSTGVHAVAQIFEDFLASNPDTHIYRMAFFFDEYIGHLFVVTLTIVLMFVAFMELNRKRQQLSKLDDYLVITTGVLNGAMWGLMGVEGGSIYLLIIPTMFIALWSLRKTLIKHSLKLNDYPFTKYSVIATSVMLICVIWWVASRGWFVQPSDLGYELMRF
ncbi:MAG: hypothetical protein HN846_00100 [Candidatus Pacebacteria bacterium]|jgi:hypothetical protein|nr:hypothetical protein [Candidatus Paceibacterota bacterium]MBT3512179.1 hypothetical protein [Candidatus Paceibacterota bacterium]MBT4004906.1 hypothetical protein [Candidatus Paceibacterota bacterium]MBT4358652.1 hypothetical protein [Candidatus Paceibacterota bacterium]MBT4681353.1 hypothetical protein [Candidatus Paceibacterota bacterium]